MESSYVVKVQNSGTIRRLTLAKGDTEFSYKLLQNRIRDLFHLHTSAQFGLTYVDKDGDVVTMAEDEDLKDALVLQALNPLRVTLENVKGDVKTSSPILPKEANSDDVKEQQTVQGELVHPTLSKSMPVETGVAKAETVQSSDERGANAEPSGNFGGNSAFPDEKVPKIDEAPESEASDVTSPASGPVVDGKKEVSPEGAAESKSQGEADCSKENRIHFGIQCDGCGMVPISGPRYVSRRKQNYDLCGKCYEASGAEEDEYAKIDRLFYRIGYPAYFGGMRRRGDQRVCWKPDQRPNSTPDAPKIASTAGSVDAGNKTAAETPSANPTPPVLHMGVQCDQCGMVPLEGPRFKSSTRFNYDLCKTCFETSGSNASEYSRIDQPVLRCGYPLAMRQLLRRAPPQSRQDPRSGRFFWVLNRLVPIEAIDQAEAEEKTTAAAGDGKAGGDPVNPPQAEVAAQNTSPTGVADATTSASKQEGPAQDQAVDATGGSKTVQIPVINTKEAEKQAVDAEGKSHVAQIPVINTRGVDLGTSSVPEIQAPVDDVQNVSTENVTVNNLGETAGAEENVAAPAAEGDLSTKEGLLAKLAAMGFEDPKLNEELLEKNSFDLRKTLDDLCAAEEWDPILGELEEMGFYDANMNRRLMFKNNGSVKRVVKDLVQMYKGEKLA